jgi:3'-phosphoadenosine 5'-phosphosulfate sulfotransferase (PAPS reductase)/FAD synthetase
MNKPKDPARDFDASHCSTVLNYGGGRQTVAMCVMIAKGVLPRPDIIVMADTGRENPSTWEYLDQHVKPFLAKHDLQVEIAPHSLATVDIYGKNGDLLLPVFTETGKLRTYCSNEWKRRVVDRYLRSKNITSGERWIGFGFDEKKR